MTWQAVTKLHPGAQRSEHRIKVPSARKIPTDGTTTMWQSVLQLGAQPQHHLGISFLLDRMQYIRRVFNI